jgi:hypothetical protein
MTDPLYFPINILAFAILRLEHVESAPFHQNVSLLPSLLQHLTLVLHYCAIT